MKYEVLQQYLRLYDPLGFLAPVTVQAKILLELWQLKIQWDDPLNLTTQDGKTLLVLKNL